MNKRLLVLMLLVALGVTTFAVACGGDNSTDNGDTAGAEAPGGTVGDPNTLNVGVPDLGAELLDPCGPADAEPLFLVYEPLLRYDEQGNLMGWLAETWSMSEDGMVWTFNLRQGVKWSNGDPFTSADVKFSLERYIDPSAQNPWAPVQRDHIDHVEAPDDYTVNVHMKGEPYVFYGDALTGAMIMPKAYFEEVGYETFVKQPMGTGPWVQTNYVSGSKAEFEASQEYWGDKPVWSKMNLLLVSEESTRIAMLKRGELDITPISIDNAVSLRDEGFELRQTHLATIPAVFLAGYYLQPGPTSDVRVREAMDIAINRQEICDSFFKGFAEPAAGNIGLTETAWGFNPVWYSVEYDPERAMQLLQEADYPQNFADPVIRVYSTVQAQYTWEPDFIQILAGYWEAIGIKTEVIPMEQTALRTDWVNQAATMMGGVCPWIGNSADNSMAAFQNHYTSEGVNHSGNDPEFDKLFLQMTGELDDDKRLELWQTVQQKAFDNHSVLGIVRQIDQYAVSDKIGEWTGVDWVHYGFEIGLAGVQKN